VLFLGSLTYFSAVKKIRIGKGLMELPSGWDVFLSHSVV